MNLVGFDDKLSKFLKHEIDSINLHLPKKKVSLESASQGHNYYMNREDSQLLIDKKEVDLLIEICPKIRIKQVYLPILIIRRRDLGAGTYVIAGELIEQYLVLRAIEKLEISWDQFKDQPDISSSTFLYKPDLIELRKILPTSTIVGFS